MYRVVAVINNNATNKSNYFAAFFSLSLLFVVDVEFLGFVLFFLLLLLLLCE